MPLPETTLCMDCAKSTNSRRCAWDGQNLRLLPEGAEYTTRPVVGSVLYCVTKCPAFERGRVGSQPDLHEDNLLALVERFGEDLGTKYRDALLVGDRNAANAHAREIRQSYLLACVGVDTEALVQDLRAQTGQIKRAVDMMIDRGDMEAVRQLAERFPDNAESIMKYAESAAFDADPYEDFSSSCRYYDFRGEDTKR